jgi:hypothetical protein
MTSQKKNRNIRQRRANALLPLVCQEAVQSVSEAWKAAIVQPDDLGGYCDRQRHAHCIKVCAPDGAEVPHDPRALLGHQLAVTHGNDLGSKKTRRRAALLAMGFALLEQDRRTAAPGEAVCKIRHEARLTQAVAAKDLPRKVYATNPDFFARYALKCGLVICPVVGRCFPVVSAVQLHWVKSPYRSRYR